MPDEWTSAPNTTGQPVPPGLFLFSVDGQAKPRLLFRNVYTPAWSPDGKRLAFSVGLPGGQWALHAANVDGSRDVRLTEPSLMAGSPAWSPDGKRIAYAALAGQGRQQQIFVMEANGDGVRQLTTDANWSCGHPSWSPDGNRIVFFCGSASAPCGPGFTDTGSAMPARVRRLFTISLHDSRARPTQITEHDGASPVFAP